MSTLSTRLWLVPVVLLEFLVSTAVVFQLGLWLGIHLNVVLCAMIGTLYAMAKKTYPPREMGYERVFAKILVRGVALSAAGWLLVSVLS